MTQTPNISWVHPQQISQEDKFELVEKLLACPTMSNKDTRETVLGELGDIARVISRSTIDKVDVMNIVNGCLHHANGLSRLITIVKYFEGDDSLPMKDLEAFLEDMLIAQAISKEFFEELKQIAQGIHISKNALADIYLQSVSRSPDWPLPDTQGSDETKTLALMLRELAQHAQKKHIVRFVKQLISHVHEPAVQQSLRSWVERAKSKFALSQTDLAVLPVSGRSPSLQVKFITDEDAPGLVSIEACFLGEREEYNKVLRVDGEPRSYETVPELLDRLLLEGEKLVKDPDNQKITIELFFSDAFLNYNIDHWKISLGRRGKVAMTDYSPLVVRSLDRIKSGETTGAVRMRMQWKRRWSIFKQQIDAPLQPYYLSAHMSEREDFFGELLNIPCFALTFAPPAVSDGDSSHIFFKMIDAGIPIAFWPQCTIEQMDEQAIEQTYTSFWPTCDIPDLPRLIWEKRRNNVGPLLFRRLVLLWDDPDRLPKDWLLKKEVQDE